MGSVYRILQTIFSGPVVGLHNLQFKGEEVLTSIGANLLLELFALPYDINMFLRFSQQCAAESVKSYLLLIMIMLGKSCASH